MRGLGLIHPRSHGADVDEMDKSSVAGLGIYRDKWAVLSFQFVARLILLRSGPCLEASRMVCTAQRAILAAIGKLNRQFPVSGAGPMACCRNSWVAGCLRGRQDWMCCVNECLGSFGALIGANSCPQCRLQPAASTLLTAHWMYAPQPPRLSAKPQSLHRDCGVVEAKCPVRHNLRQRAIETFMT